MNSLTRKLLVAFCLATGLTSSAHAQFSFFPYISGPSQPASSPLAENRSTATGQYVHPAEKRAHKSHKNVAAH